MSSGAQMAHHFKATLSAILVAGTVCFSLGARASTVVTWNGADSFNGTTAGSGGDDITFAGFTANQLTLISGTGTYEASTSHGSPVNTTFDLWLDLNGTWTVVDTWQTNATTEQLLSQLSTPFDFTTSTVTGIALTATPHGSEDDPTFDNFYSGWFWDDHGNGESFTFNDRSGVGQTPVPAALPLLASGLGMIALFARRQRRKAIALT